MKIKLNEITIRDIVKGYVNDEEEGVVGFGGKLNIRPKYQREFIYKEKQQNAVIETVRKDFPLNVMYWVKNEDGTYEVMDGQQRTISICEYIIGKFSLNNHYFHNLEEDEKEQILNYKTMIYFCEGTQSEILDWFKIINIAGMELTAQELRNTAYAGIWLSDAKRHFSKTNCAAYGMASGYMKGSPIRQDYLETAIDWISGGHIEEYMAENQHKPNANELWLYFQNVVNWVKVVFPKYYKEMKGVAFGRLYNEFKDKELDSQKLEEEITKLMLDEDVTNKKGIYEYVLTREEKYLNIRAFSDNQKREAYEKQKGICPKCGKYYEIEQMEGDHIMPWREGGKTVTENCQMLCKTDNRIKAGK